MKIEPRQAAAFLKNPGTTRIVLLHGDDDGLIRDRAASLIRLVAGSLNDPFRVAELDKAGWPRLSDEVSALSMMGGRRAVRIRDVTDAILDHVKTALKSAGDALVVLEAPDLGKGRLRTFMEAGEQVASLACYAEEGAALHTTIKSILGETGVSIEGEAVAWLAETLSGSRAGLRAELEKLALLSGAGGRVTLELAQEAAGEAVLSSADDGLLAALAGDVAGSDNALERAMAEGLTGVALLRMALGQLQRLHQTRLRMASGQTAAEALRFLRPPVFFKAMGVMQACLAVWSVTLLEAALEECRRTEIACKQTGARQELLARRFVGSLARRAQQRVQRR